MNPFHNVVDVLWRNCREGRQGIVHVQEDGSEVNVSYQDLFARSRALLGRFQQLGLRKDDELVFQLESNEHFLTVLWACLMGGIIAVPISVGYNAEHRLKLFKVWQVLNRPRLVYAGKVLNGLRRFAATHGLEEQLATMVQSAISLEPHLEGPEVPAELYPTGPDDIAFLQFSSGSTGEPKGVILTHGNVLANLDACMHSAAITAADSFLSWLPLTHDMGLVGFHLVPTMVNVNQVLLPTLLFVNSPYTWFDKADRHRATILSSPNFGYKYFLAAFKPELAPRWDLSAVRLLFNAAEPISAEECDEFLERMQPYGLKRTTMYPVYGLAEATAAAAFPPPGEEFVTVCVDRDSLIPGHSVRELADRTHRNALVFVEEGSPVKHCEVRICDEENRPLGDRILGRIQIRGLNVTRGYYKDPTTTAAAIRGDGWLDVGDLGFLRAGRVVVTGRIKEIIFVNGENYYPQDLERVAAQVPQLQLRKIAACGVYSEAVKRDEIILFVQYRQELVEFAPLALQVKRLIGSRMGLAVREVIPVREIPMTTSGKFRRYQLGDQYREGVFDELLIELHRLIALEVEPENGSHLSEAERALLAICREVMETADIRVHDNLSDYGAGSLLLAQIHQRVDRLYPGKTTLSNLFAYPSVAKLAYFIDYGGTITLPHVALPQSYVSQGAGERETAVLRLTLEGERYRKVQRVAESEGIAPDVLLLTVLAYLLSEVAEAPQVAVQAMVGPAADRVVSVVVNVEGVADFTALFQLVARQCSGQEAATLYRVQDLGKVRLGRERGELLPLFYVRTYLSATARLLDVYDLVLEVQYGEGEATCHCEIDLSRLSKAKVAELLGDYVQLLDHLLDQYGE